jgi:hypothetical protein
MLRMMHLATGVACLAALLAPQAAKAESRIQTLVPLLTSRSLDEGGISSVRVRRGPWRLAVTVRNPSGQRLRGRVEAHNPDRFLGTVVSRLVSVPPGGAQTVVIPLPGAVPAQDQSYEFTVDFQGWDGAKDTVTRNIVFLHGSQGRR